MAAGLNWLLRWLGRESSEAESDPEGVSPADSDDVPDPEPEGADEDVTAGELEAEAHEDDAEAEAEAEFADLEPASLDDHDGHEQEAEADGGEDGPDDEAIDDLYYRTEGLEESIEDTEMRLDAIQDSQEQVVSQVDELNDRVRRMLGLYDQVTDDINPFTGEGEADNGFEVFGDEHADTGEATEAETISFDDLKSGVETEPAGAVEDEPEPEPTADPQLEDRDADEPTLQSLPDAYATDVIVFEWLADLLESGGPRATLEALSYYVELGWIDPEVRVQLEAVLSGPGLETEASAKATELTADDHADSYAYVMQLRELHEIKRTVEP
ncbi:FlaD/FlaE family flagellar protein [Natronococcus sp. A-GB1]|uniref:FlaD/FlaE family flagellar protein n=1 Tax=Natronococcus sp. A-GB1 TaxID=3037648 RepID=UPI00241F3858|nr:FlaD/FlaE family flagellar protein [Natronococcus sp. A-GB1]MDG5758811.1 FlaD/FlaE family flagellar protein [Natronococcus sp. A-GB1]